MKERGHSLGSTFLQRPIPGSGSRWDLRLPLSVLEDLERQRPDNEYRNRRSNAKHFHPKVSGKQAVAIIACMSTSSHFYQAHVHRVNTLWNWSSGSVMNGSPLLTHPVGPFDLLALLQGRAIPHSWPFGREWVHSMHDNPQFCESYAQGSLIGA